MLDLVSPVRPGRHGSAVRGQAQLDEAGRVADGRCGRPAHARSNNGRSNLQSSSASQPIRRGSRICQNECQFPQAEQDERGIRPQSRRRSPDRTTALATGLTSIPDLDDLLRFGGRLALRLGALGFLRGKCGSALAFLCSPVRAPWRPGYLDYRRAAKPPIEVSFQSRGWLLAKTFLSAVGEAVVLVGVAEQRGLSHKVAHFVASVRISSARRRQCSGWSNDLFMTSPNRVRSDVSWTPEARRDLLIEAVGKSVSVAYAYQVEAVGAGRSPPAEAAAGTEPDEQAPARRTSA